MKRIKSTSIVCLVISLLLLTACGKDAANDTNKDDNKVQVVTSFYPIYYMANEIGGDAVQVTNLISTGVEPHNWSPKSKDLLVASDADLLLYHGAGFETWIDSFKKGLDKNSEVVVKEVSEGISLIGSEENEITHEEAHDHDADHEDHAHEEETHDHDANHEDHAHEEEAHDHSHTTDPHTWVSPKSALVLAENIKNALVEVNPAQEQLFEQNYKALVDKISAIDAKYEAEINKLENKHIVVSHQSFGYVARDYGLEQISIMGINPNSEPRAQDIKNIAELVKQNNVKYIFFEELVNDNLAKMLASEAKVDTMVLYSLEGLTTKQEKQGENYISLMELNLQNIISALQ